MFTPKASRLSLLKLAGFFAASSSGSIRDASLQGKNEDAAQSLKSSFSSVCPHCGSRSIVFLAKHDFCGVCHTSFNYWPSPFHRVRF